MTQVKQAFPSGKGCDGFRTNDKDGKEIQCHELSGLKDTLQAI